jgi:hypothetical protein
MDVRNNNLNITSLDYVMLQTVREQAERKGFEFFLSAEYFNLELSMGSPKLTYLSAVRHDPSLPHE